MKKILSAILLMGSILPVQAQQKLSLQDCRDMAMRNNKQMQTSNLKKEVATNMRKVARTKYLPKVDAIGGYQYFSQEISLLSDDQKNSLNNLGTSLATAGGQSMQGMGNTITTGFQNFLTGMVQQGMLSPQAAQGLGQQLGQQLNQMGTNIGTALGQSIGQAGNQIGKKIADGFRTDTHNIWSGAIMVRQPIFMGGAIAAANKIADITEQMANDDVDLKKQTTLYNVDQAYWLVVSLRNKQKLAKTYSDLVKKLDSDVDKLIREGVATKSQKLRVDVKVNEAEMSITQCEDGLVLSKMLLCQLCGLPMDQDITLEDEGKEQLGTTDDVNTFEPDSAISSRPEVRLLDYTRQISEQTVKLTRAQYLPHVALTGGYLISNPNVFNGFQNKFGGTWNVGVTVQIPVWNWMEGSYKVRATKAATTIAQMDLADVREKISLQISQSRFKVTEAQKKLRMAEKNIASAEENLRCANVGFKEGVMEVTDVMAAQTAWQKAQSQRIDAEIEVKLAQVGLNKALGILN